MFSFRVVVCELAHDGARLAGSRGAVVMFGMVSELRNASRGVRES